MQIQNQPLPHSKLYMKLSKHKSLALTFIIFLLLIISTFYFAFNEGRESNSEISDGENKITGLITKSNNNQENSKTLIKASLTVPNLEIKTKSSQVHILIGSVNTILFVGNEKFDLSEIASDIVIFDFDGRLTFDNENILQLDGKSTKVLLNGIPTTPQTGKTVKIKVSEDFLYKSVKIEDVSLNSLSYMTSGDVSLGNDKIILKINKEELSLDSFSGDLEIKDDVFFIDGEAEKIKIIGEKSLEIE